MSEIRIADLSHRVRLEQATRAGDGGGGAAISFSLVAEFWAGLRPISGREGLEAEARSGRALFDVVCRYRTDVKVKHRLVIGSRILEISSVTNVNDDKQFLKLRCEEIVA